MAIAKLVKPVKVNNVTTSIKEFSKGDSFTLKGDGTSEAAEIVLNNTANTFSTTIKSAEVASNITFTLPDNDGSNGQILRTDGNGNLTFVNDANATVLADDSSPQLAANLDVNGNSIVSVSNADVSLIPDGTGTVLIDGDGSTGGITLESGSIDVKNSGAVSNIKFYDENNSNYIQLQSASHSSYSGNVTLTLPTTSGSLITSESVVYETTKDFVATGTIATGDIVGLRSDGTVEVITDDPTNVQNSNLGTASTFDSAAYNISSTFDTSQNAVVVAYKASNGYGRAKVGIVSGTSISFGSSVDFYSAGISAISAIFDSNSNKVVIVFNTSNSEGRAIVGTVSGNSISFGSSAAYSLNTGANVSATFDSNSNKVVIAYRDNANSGYGTAVVGTVSGSSISYGSSVRFQATNHYNLDNISATFDSNSNKVVISHRDTQNSNYGTAVVGTVSGTSISFGSAVVFESANTTQISSTFDSSQNKVVIAYADQGNTGSGTAIVGTVSGNSISFGTPIVFQNSINVYPIFVGFDPFVNRVLIAYGEAGNSRHGKINSYTISGTTFTSGASTVFWSSPFEVHYTSVTFDTNLNKNIIFFQDDDPNGTNTFNGKAIVYEAPGTYTTTNAASWIGIARENISNTATGEIILISSVVDGLSSLTTGADYFVNYDGTLTATENAGPVTGTYGKIGRAISTTKLLITEGND